MNWQEMLKDKRLWVGVGLAAALGLGVMLQRKKSADATSSTGSGPTLSTLGTADTTGTDIASWLGSYSQSLQNVQAEQNNQTQEILKGYGQSLTSAVDELVKLQQLQAGASQTEYTAVQVNTGQHLGSLFGGGVSDQEAAKLLKSATGGNLQWPVITTAGPQGFGPGPDLVFAGPTTVRVPK